MTPGTPAGDNGSDDDQHWFDLLAGRAAPGAGSATQAEAAALRRALQHHGPQAPEGSPAAADARIARLLERARAEGVLLVPQTEVAPAQQPAQPQPQITDVRLVGLRGVAP